MAQAVTVTGGRVRLAEGNNETFDTVAWVYADGRLIDGTVPSRIRGTVIGLAATSYEQLVTVGDALLYARPVPVSGHRVTAVVTVDLKPYHDSERRALLMTLTLGAATIALAVLVAFVVARRAMQVVHTMSALADDWSEHDPGRRFAGGPPRDEFGELAHTLDHLLDRVSQSLAQERRLTEEIAHELRNPIAVLRGEAQLAELGGDRLAPEVVLTEVDRLERAVSAILAASRARLGAQASCRLADALRRCIAGRDITVGCPDELQVAVPAEVVEAIVAPMLENAVRHAARHVRLSGRRDDDDVVLDVLDDGPGFAADEVETAFEPGVSALWRFGANPVLSFWLAYVLTRPLGANIGDWLASPKVAQNPGDPTGLGMGTFVTSLIFLGLILATVVYLTVSRADVVETYEATHDPVVTPDVRRERVALAGFAVLAALTAGLLVWAHGRPHATPAAEGDATSTARLAPGQAVARFPAAKVAELKELAGTALSQDRAGDATAAHTTVQKLRDLWDADQDTLDPLDDTGWTFLDAQMDAVLGTFGIDHSNPPAPAVEQQKELTALLIDFG